MPTPPNLSDFPNHSFQDVRFADIDMLGHVNNAVYATYIETARVQLTFDNNKMVSDDGCVVVLARLTIDFLKELNWPNRICVASGVTRIGRSSVTMRHAIFTGDICVATAESIIVLIDVKTRKSTAVPPTRREKLQALMMPSPT